ncbi:diguanylate cyclase [Psychrobacillus sp. FSL K6-2684]|uniref:sensor domain-containing diguanylate cyclase n=1 Tax=Psychrobacillus sp. FSL K6-2684 TaxID=2921547 RepID=UPI0030F7E625
MDNQIDLTKFKGKVFDIWTEFAFSHESSAKWFEDFKILLAEFFDVKYAGYYIQDAHTFIQLKWNHSLTKKREAIRWHEIEGFFYEKDFAEIPFIRKEEKLNREVSILLRDEENVILGMLMMDLTEKWERFSQTPDVNEFIAIVSKLIKVIRKSVYLTQQEHQYRNLFNVTKMFHSTLEIDQILQGTLFAIHDAFPDFGTTLILSNDQDRKTSVPYKLFDYTAERPATVEAYVSGEITSDLVEDLEMRQLNVPIKGKQGNYGILQVSTPLDYLFSYRQKEFITMLAATAGNALENAKLFIQSHRLVGDLQLINETTHKLNMNLSQGEMVIFLRNQLMKSFQPEHVCFVFIEDEEYSINAASSDYFYTIEGQMYIQHVGNQFKKMKDSLFIADFNRISNANVAYRSLVAIPLREQDTITGFSIVLHSEPYYFSFDSFKLMQSLIQHSSLALSNSALRHKLQEMVDRDHLTNLYARSYLDRYVEESMEKDTSGTFVLMDIDNFKQINDTHGHQIGDSILRQIATVIEKQVEKLGIGARWGGEELALYFSEMTLEEGKKICKSLLEIIPIYTNPSVTVSIGVSLWCEDGEMNFHNLFHHADTALYEAKNNGKNQLCVYKADHF